MSSSDYIYYELAPGLLDRLGLPHLPFPVRKEEAWRIFRGRQVEVGRLVDELDRFIADEPEAGQRYRTTIAVLTYVLAIRAGTSGDAEGANRLLALGLKHRPGNVSLRANHAFSLHALGRYDEALAAYRTLLSESGNGGDPLIRMLAARALADSGDALSAYRMLIACPAALAGDGAFRKLVSRYRERAGLGAPEWVEPASAAPANAASGRAVRRSRAGKPAVARPPGRRPTETGHRSCARCEQPLPESARFCPGCGQAVKP